MQTRFLLTKKKLKLPTNLLLFEKNKLTMIVLSRSRYELPFCLLNIRSRHRLANLFEIKGEKTYWMVGDEKWWKKMGTDEKYVFCDLEMIKPTQIDCCCSENMSTCVKTTHLDFMVLATKSLSFFMIIKKVFCCLWFDR